MSQTRGGRTALSAAFKRFRRRVALKPIAGGFACRVVEPTRTGAGWLPHIHSVVECTSPLDVSVTAEAWLGALRSERGATSLDAAESLFVPHRDMPGAKFSQLARYVTQRCLSEWLQHSDEVLLKVAVANIGTRRSSYFGAWRGRR